MKQDDIKAGIIQAIVMRCSCELNLSNIVGDIFSYWGSQDDFEKTVVFRAMITLPVPVSATDADNIVDVISDWVKSKNEGPQHRGFPGGHPIRS